MMELKEPLMNGVLIVHQFEDGKHHYEVKNVVNLKKGRWKKMFASGDQLMQVNDKDLQDVAADELAKMLAGGNPMLTIHKPGRNKEKPEGEALLSKKTLQPFTKEYTTLTWDWEMTRVGEHDACQQEEEEEGGEGGEEEEGGEGGEEEEGGEGGEEEEEGGEEEEEEEEEEGRGGEEGGGGEGKDEESMEGNNLLVIELTKASIAVVSGRGCGESCPTDGCNGSGCIFNDIVVVAESSRVTIVPRGSISFKQKKLLNVLVEHFPTQRYLRGVCSQSMSVYASPNSEKITLYYYKPSYVDKPFRGSPVVLNLTGSNCFLKCCTVETRVFIQVEAFEKEKLKVISGSDDSTLCFVFYMKGDVSGQRTFESAIHKDWFIRIINLDTVQVEKKTEQLDQGSFLFVIHHK